MNLAELLKEEAKWTLTENGADALKSTGSAMLDFYGEAGAMRYASPERLSLLFQKAFIEDPLRALKCLFYLRDIREGQGERDVFRFLLRGLAFSRPEAVIANMRLIPFYGRYDDYYCLIGTPAEEAMWAEVAGQLTRDREALEKGESLSLLAKWLKKANSSNKPTREFGIYTALHLGLKVSEYKRITSALRKALKVVEVDMSRNAWEDITYESVPARAMRLYRDAFPRHDRERFDAYMEKVKEGRSEIHAQGLYPYDFIELIFKGVESPVLEEQWKALPDYVGDGGNFLIMADVSGSMTGRPMATSVGLAIYFAERNQGAYHNLFMTFSQDPQIVSLKGESLYEKAIYVHQADWGMNTDLLKAMKKVLDIAVKNHCTQEELPRALIIITDMEFDSAMSWEDDLTVSKEGDSWEDFRQEWESVRSLLAGALRAAAGKPAEKEAGKESEPSAPEVPKKRTYKEIIDDMFSSAGYQAPAIVFWNADSKHEVFHTEANDNGAILVSGQSASTFQNLVRYLNGEAIISPVEYMRMVLDSERYQAVVLPREA